MVVSMLGLQGGTPQMVVSMLGLQGGTPKMVVVKREPPKMLVSMLGLQGGTLKMVVLRNHLKCLFPCWVSKGEPPVVDLSARHSTAKTAGQQQGACPPVVGLSICYIHYMKNIHYIHVSHTLHALYA